MSDREHGHMLTELIRHLAQHGIRDDDAAHLIASYVNAPHDSDAARMHAVINCTQHARIR